MKNTSLDVSAFREKTGKDYYFPICNVMYCGTHIPADSSSVPTSDKNLKTPQINWFKIRIMVQYIHYLKTKIISFIKYTTYIYSKVRSTLI